MGAAVFPSQRASYSLGSHIGANPQTFEPVSDPYLATFLEPQKKGANLRLAFLRSTQDKAGREAFQADAGYGALTSLKNCDDSLNYFEFWHTA